MDEQELQEIEASAQEPSTETTPEAPPPPSLNERAGALRSELEQNLASFEENFAKKAADEVNNNPELEELFFENREDFFKKILELQNAFITSEIDSKKDELAAVESDIAMENQMNTMQEAQEAFLQNHPDVDINVLLDFYMNDLSPKEQQALEQLTPDELFEAIYQIYLMKTGQAQPQEANEQEQSQDAELPKQVGGYPADIQSGNSETLPTDRY